MFVVNVKGNGRTSFHFETQNKDEAIRVYNTKVRDVANARTGERVELLENGRRLK